jgi:hypothetical protein
VAVHRLAHGPDVVGIRPATAAHHARPRRDHPRRVVGHVRRRRDVDEPLADPARQPGIRLDGDGQASHLGQHVLEHVEERTRADRAVGADHLDGQIPEGPCHLGRGVAEKGHEVLGERDLGNDGQVGDGANRLHGQLDLGEIGERLDHEGVDSSLEKSLGLLEESRPALFGGDGAERGEVLAEGAHGAHHEDVAPHRLAARHARA